MWYISTRGMAPRVNFEGALFSGYAPDGGLFMPEELPQLDRETLRRWSTLSYPSLVQELCALFIGPELIPRDDLNGEYHHPHFHFPSAASLAPHKLQIRHSIPRRTLVTFPQIWHVFQTQEFQNWKYPRGVHLIQLSPLAKMIFRECFYSF